MRTFSPELWHRSAKWNFTFFAFENSEREEKKSICMLVETRIHLTLTELRSLDFAIPLLYMTFTHRASDSERVEGKKKSGGWWGRRSNKKWLLEGGMDIQQMGAKKVSMSCQIKLITQTFFKLGVFFFYKNNCRLKSSKIIGHQSSAKSILKMSRSKWIY